MKKLIPADMVDANGNVWPTTGENIRKGAKEFYENEVKAIVNVLFPVGSVYCGDNPFITSVGKWDLLTNGNNRPIIEQSNYESGKIIASPYLVQLQETTGLGVAMRVYRRVS